MSLDLLSLPSAAPGVAGHFFHKATVVTYISLGFHSTTRVFSAKLFTSPQPVCVSAWGFFLQGWDLAFLFARLHEVPVRPAHQPLKVHLNDNTTIWCINHPLLPTFCHLQSVILFHNLVVKENAK